MAVNESGSKRVGTGPPIGPAVNFGAWPVAVGAEPLVVVGACFLAACFEPPQPLRTMTNTAQASSAREERSRFTAPIRTPQPDVTSGPFTRMRNENPQPPLADATPTDRSSRRRRGCARPVRPERYRQAAELRGRGRRPPRSDPPP